MNVTRWDWYMVSGTWDMVSGAWDIVSGRTGHGALGHGAHMEHGV